MYQQKLNKTKYSPWPPYSTYLGHALRMNEYISESLRKFGSTLAAGTDLSTYVMELHHTI